MTRLTHVHSPSKRTGLLKRVTQAGVAALLASATLLTGVVAANAVTGDGYPGIAYEADGATHYLGIMTRTKDGRNAYCIEYGVITTPKPGEWTTENWDDNPDAVIAAQLAQSHQNDNDDTTQAAIAYAIHDHLDIGTHDWNAAKGAIDQARGDIAPKAAELWDQAKKSVVDDGISSAEWKYTEGQRAGTVNVYLKNSDGEYLSGVPYRVVSDGPVQIDGDVNGTTNGQPLAVNWKATGEGQVSVKVQYDQYEAEKLMHSTKQKQMTYKQGDPTVHNGPSVEFKVDNRFNPGLTSDQSDHRVENGQAPEDDLTTTTRQVDGNDVPWTEGVNVKFEGKLYYSKNEIPVGDTVPQDATLAATAEKTFGKSGESQHVSKDDIKIDSAFAAANNGATVTSLPTGYYVWVWGYEKDHQADDVKGKLADDSWNDGVKAEETAAAFQAMQPDVTSSASEAYQGKSAYIGDDKIVHVEKGTPLRDVAKVNVKDINGDGKVDTNDWLHTKDGQGEGKESEDNQISLTVKGEYLAATTKEKAAELARKAANGEKIDNADGMKVVATTEFQVNKVGDYLTSSDQSDNPTGVWKPVKGYDLANLPTGYGTFRYQIRNEDQTTIKDQTGVEPSANYPFTQDVDEGFFQADQIVEQHVMQPTISSSVSQAYEGKPGYTDDGKIVHVEKGAALRDTAKLGVTDINGDGKTDTLDWLHTKQAVEAGNLSEDNQITLTIRGEYLAATTKEKAKELQEKAAKGETIDSYQGMKVVATTTFQANKTGDYLTSSDPKDTPAGTWTAVKDEHLDDLPTGYGTFRYTILNKDQDTEQQTGVKQGDGYPFVKDVDEGFFQTDQVIEKHLMQPTLTSSVTGAYQNDQSTVTGVDGKDRPAVQDTTTGDNPDGVIHLEKGITLRDNLTIGHTDVNGDGKADTLDWLHTKQGIADGNVSEDTQIEITAKGEFIGVSTRDEANKLMEQARKGTLTELPKGAKVLATATVKVNKDGTYLVSSDTGENPTGVWTPANGVDLANLPSGYGTFRWTISNEDQDTESQTGVKQRKDYPFLKNVDDGVFSDNENLNIRLTPRLDSETSLKSIKAGETTTDKLIIGKSNEDDLWPTYDMTDVTEGESASSDPIPLDFHGYLVKVSDDPNAKVTETETISEEQKAQAVHEATFTAVTGFGEHTTDAYTLKDNGTYVWYWELTPNLKGALKLTDIAWRQLTHKLNNHAFGMASETVRVTSQPKEETPSCEISTKSQGKVTMSQGKADLTDTAKLNCEKAARVEFELWKQGNGDLSTDTRITVTDRVDVNGQTELKSPSVTVTQDGTYYWREKAYDSDGGVVSYGKPRVPDETVIVERPSCQVSTKSQGVVTMTDGKAVLHDEASIQCADAAKIEYELWKQTEGQNADKDVLITVTPQHDVKGDTDRSDDVTVTETGTYYWREKTYDANGQVISYGKARASEETVKVVDSPAKAILAQTGTTMAMVIGGAALCAGVGVAGWLISRKRRSARHTA